MKTAQQVMNAYADETGWNENTQLALAFEFLTELFVKVPEEATLWEQFLKEIMLSEREAA